MLIIILVMIKHDQLLNLNSWYELTSKLIATHLIDVMSWAFNYAYDYDYEPMVCQSKYSC
jgi:hypothetical protein